MASPSHTPLTPELQNSYGPEMATSEHSSGCGPEMAASEHKSNDGPQAVPVVGGLEVLPRQEQVASPLEDSIYTQQAEKNNNYPEVAEETTPIPRKRFLGLPRWGVWLLVAIAMVALGLGLGVGIGVGLDSQKSSTSTNRFAPSVSSSSSSSSTTDTAQGTTSTATPTSQSASTTKSSTTTSSTSAAATASKVEVCQNADLDSCTTVTVPASSCINFSSSYNDSISSVDTGGSTCLFYTDSSCTGDYWSTSGSQNLIPGEFNDAFSSVKCD